MLWIFPIVAFPHPSTNDAIELSDLELPVLGIGFVALVVLLIRLPRSASVIRIGLGIFLLGVAASFVVGLFAFGNFQNDRFLPLIFLPVLVGGAGLVALPVGLAMAPVQSRSLISGVIIGTVAAAFVCIWLLLRGARDWLLAPYGFDVLVLILVVGVAVVVVGGLGTTARG